MNPPIITSFRIDPHGKFIHLFSGQTCILSIPFAEWARINGLAARESKAWEQNSPKAG